MYLMDATNEQIKSEAAKKGYTFTDADCNELKNGSFEGETLRESIEDYLNAYER